jgi:hypothetical protein
MKETRKTRIRILLLDSAISGIGPDNLIDLRETAIPSPNGTLLRFNNCENVKVSSAKLGRRLVK